MNVCSPQELASQPAKVLTRAGDLAKALEDRVVIVNYYAVTHDLSVGDTTVSPAPTVTLVPVGRRCGGGECPTLYKTDRGTMVVQGYVFEPAQAGVTVPPGEQLVEIPIELLTDYLPATG